MDGVGGCVRFGGWEKEKVPGGEAYADGGGAELDGFEGVFDLEETPFGREGTVVRMLVLVLCKDHGGGDKLYSPVCAKVGQMLAIKTLHFLGILRRAIFRSGHKHLDGLLGGIIVVKGAGWLSGC